MNSWAQQERARDTLSKEVGYIRKPHVNRLRVALAFPNSYWVLPAQFLAGEHPAELDAEEFRLKLAALLDAGIRTFIDLTEPRDLGEDGGVNELYHLSKIIGLLSSSSYSYSEGFE